MLGLGWSSLLKGLAAILFALGIVSLALLYFIPAPSSHFPSPQAEANQIYQAIGNQYRDILARSHVNVDIQLTNGAVENIGLLNDPASGIKAGIAQGGISDGEKSPDLRSLGRINYQVYWIFLQRGRHARRSEAAQGQARRAGAAGQRPEADDRKDTRSQRRQF